MRSRFCWRLSSAWVSSSSLGQVSTRFQFCWLFSMVSITTLNSHNDITHSRFCWFISSTCILSSCFCEVDMRSRSCWHPSSPSIFFTFTHRRHELSLFFRSLLSSLLSFSTSHRRATGSLCRIENFQKPEFRPLDLSVKPSARQLFLFFTVAQRPRYFVLFCSYHRFFWSISTSTTLIVFRFVRKGCSKSNEDVWCSVKENCRASYSAFWYTHVFENGLFAAIFGSSLYGEGTKIAVLV